MNRRKFVIGAAGASIGGSVLVGSGAFTSVEADRDVEVEVADDANAFLAFERKREEYVGEPDDGTLVISLGEPTTNAGGEGFNDRGLTRVDDIIGIENQGTQPAGIGFDPADDLDDDSQETTVPLENVGSATAEVTLSLSAGAADLGAGEEATISVDVDTAADPEETEETASITLSASSEAAGELDYNGEEGNSGAGGG